LNEAHFINEVNRFQAKLGKVMEKVESLEAEVQRRVRILRTEISGLETHQSKITTLLMSYKGSLERAATQKERTLQREIDLLKKTIEEMEIARPVDSSSDSESIAKATTIAIFDSILFAISNWCKSGEIAPDFELASQAVLFPIVYERVMKGEEKAYLLSQVPPSALEVVRRGREYVASIRQNNSLSLLDPTTWYENSNLIYDWWIRDGLPLLYGEQDEQWEVDASFTLEEMINWRDYPANRPLSFPTIFDGMELVEKYRDQIRENSGLPEFNKQAIQTRLD